MAKSTSKSAAKAAKAAAAPASIVDQIKAKSSSTATDESSKKKDKKEKKEKKDKKKAKAGDLEPAAEDESAPAKKDKKDKKRKASSDADADTPAAAAATKKSRSNANANGEWTYTEHPDVASMPLSDVQTYYESNQMTLEGHDGECFRPVQQFAHTGLPAAIMNVFTGFSQPTPIQAAAWPIALRNRDLIAIAETGSGKTLGFTVPALVHVQNQKLRDAAKPRKSNQPAVLVVLPTRELAMQVADVVSESGAHSGVRGAVVYGGVPKREQLATLTARGGADIVVGTPGRLVDLAITDNGALDLSRVSLVVLDEADRMLDLGFEKDIRALLGAVRAVGDRQTLMFSATWPMGVRTLAAEFLRDPVKLTIGDDELAASANVTQIVEVMKDSEATHPRGKERRLLDLLAKYHKPKKAKVLVFALYKKEAQRIEDAVRRAGYNVVGIHGDKAQAQRTQALGQFRDGSAPVLVATDVAARGLDIPAVEYVINVTFPLTIEDYVHRIGRTGRAGRSGIAHTLFTAQDKSHAGELVNVLRQANQTVPQDLLKFGTTVKKKEHKAYGAFFKEVDPSVKATKITFDSDDDE
ncbi:RNA-dependent ATPase [Allomyces arbusculus]|nr:RNA-dependent ATPase [Allomyces arbusculus]